jgi:hypothetical protein
MPDTVSLIRRECRERIAEFHQKIVSAVRDGEDPDAVAARLGVTRPFVFYLCRIAKVDTSRWNRRGFRSFSHEEHLAICSRGGKKAQATGKAHRFTRKEARAAGILGAWVRNKQKRENL